jgi:hypothetical protein
MKARGGMLGVILVVALLGYGVLSGQLSPGQILDELLGGGGGGGMPPAAQNAPSAEAASRQLSELRVRPALVNVVGELQEAFYVLLNTFSFFEHFFGNWVLAIACNVPTTR